MACEDIGCIHCGVRVEKEDFKFSLKQKHGKCSKCHQNTDNLLLSRCASDDGHVFCVDCFKKTNKNYTSENLKCPCCREIFCHDAQSVEEGILIGEGNYYCYEARYQASLRVNDMSVYKIRVKAVEQYEAALVMNPTNWSVIEGLNALYIRCLQHCGEAEGIPTTAIQATIEYKILNQKLHDSCLFAIDQYLAMEKPLFYMLKHYCLILANMFDSNSNYAASMKYYKLAYEYCLRSSDQPYLDKRKKDYIRAKEKFSKEPALRFAVGDEVECYVENANTEGGEWKFGVISELHHRERSFPVEFSAPYCIRLLAKDDSSDRPPAYAWVKADIDRYVRKVGVKLIEETRYQFRLEAKVAQLAQVYCSKEFVLEVYRILKQDREFVNRLRTEWEIELTERLVYIYRMLVMYRQLLIRTDFGYRLPSTEDVVHDIKTYFAQAALATSTSNSARDTETTILLHPDRINPFLIYGSDCAASCYIRFFIFYLQWYRYGRVHVPLSSLINEHNCEVCGFSLPPPAPCLSPLVLKAFSTVKPHQYAGVAKHSGSTEVMGLAMLWTEMCSYIEKSQEHAAECPFIYFFVKYCLDHGMGVPKPALAVYDRMNMQLCREFIRCANPTCKLNKLDQSTGQVKFKLCGGCGAVIYCSRECCVAHYPEHKALCREHSTC